MVESAPGKGSRLDLHFQMRITDLNMPGVSGIEVARTLKLVRPALPVPPTSGFITDDLREQVAAVGITRVLRKRATVEAPSEAGRSASNPTPNDEYALPDPPG